MRTERRPEPRPSTASAPGCRSWWRQRVGRTALEPLLSVKQATDLAGLLTAVSQQARLGPEYRDQADYWAGQVEPGRDADCAQTIAGLLQDVAASPWLPAHIEQWARVWAASLEELAE
jgi:hypothetical protein